MSMPSDSHSSTRSTSRTSGQCRFSRASAALSSHRWFGVCTPPRRSGSAAARAIRSNAPAKGRSAFGTASPCSSAYVSHRSLMVNAVSGGELMFSPSKSPFSPCIPARNSTSLAAARAASVDPEKTESWWTAQVVSVLAADMTARWCGSPASRSSSPSEHLPGLLVGRRGHGGQKSGVSL